MDTAMIRLDAETAVRADNKIYFFGKSYNLLYCIDDNTKEVSIIGSVPDEPINSQRLVGKILSLNGKLILVPLLGKKIWIVDQKDNIWKSVELRDTNTTTHMFFQGHVFKNTVYMIGCEYPYVVVMNCDDYSLEYDDSVFCELRKKEKSKGDIYFRSDYIREGDDVIMGCCLSHYLLKYNLSNRQFNFIEKRALPDYECISKTNNCEVYTSRSEKKIMIKKPNIGESVIEIPEGINLRCVGIQQKDEDIYFYSSEIGDSCVYSEKYGFRKIDKNLCMFVNDGVSSIWMDTKGHVTIEDDENCRIEKCYLSRDVITPHLKKSLMRGSVLQEGMFALNDYVDALVWQEEET